MYPQCVYVTRSGCRPRDATNRRHLEAQDNRRRARGLLRAYVNRDLVDVDGLPGPRGFVGIHRVERLRTVL